VAIPVADQLVAFPVTADWPTRRIAFAPNSIDKENGDVPPMSKGDELKFQRGAASKAESEDGNDGGKNRGHAHDGMAAAHKSLGVPGVSEF